MQWRTIYWLMAINVCCALAAYNRGDDKNELQNTVNCKSVCGDCNCRGFYCGEECICECDSDNDEDVNCLTRMHNKCKKLQFPFEVLIQGPSGNRFMRSALLFEELYQQCLKKDIRNRRSTIYLYKPSNGRRVRRDAEDSLGGTIDEEAQPVVSEPQEPSEDDTVGATHQIVVQPGSEGGSEPVPAAAADEPTAVDAPTVGLPLALALPAVRAKNRLTLSTIRAQYEAALARIKARIAARRPFLLAAATHDLLGSPGPDFIPLVPRPIKPLFTFKAK